MNCAHIWRKPAEPVASQHAIDCSWLQSATHPSGRSESCSGRMCRLVPRRLALCGMSCSAFGPDAAGCRSPAASGPWLRVRIGSPTGWHWLALRFGCEPPASFAPPVLLLPWPPPRWLQAVESATSGRHQYAGAPVRRHQSAAVASLRQPRGEGPPLGLREAALGQRVGVSGCCVRALLVLLRCVSRARRRWRV